MQHTDKHTQDEVEQSPQTAMEAARELTEEEQAQRKEEWSSMKDAHCAAIERMIAQGGGLIGSSEPKLGDVKVVSFVTPPKGFLNAAGKQHMLTTLEMVSKTIREIIEES